MRPPLPFIRILAVALRTIVSHVPNICFAYTSWIRLTNKKKKNNYWALGSQLGQQIITEIDPALDFANSHHGLFGQPTHTATTLTSKSWCIDHLYRHLESHCPRSHLLRLARSAHTWWTCIAAMDHSTSFLISGHEPLRVYCR